MFKSNKFRYLFIIFTILLTIIIIKYKPTEYFGYIPRVNQITHRRRKTHRQGWGESARAG